MLRIDGNYFDSYEDALYKYYESVPVGGIIIFDDVMTHSHVMDCFLAFKKDHGLPEALVRIDKSSTWFRKTVNVEVDQSKKHPPQVPCLPFLFCGLSLIHI